MNDPIEESRKMIEKGLEEMTSNLFTLFDIAYEKKIIQNKRVPKLRKRYNEIKEKGIKNMEKYVEMAKRQLESHGAKVFIAKTKEEALNYIYNEVKDEKYIVKSKCNTAKEIELTKYLNEKGIDVIETDIGDRVIQITNATPSLPVGPAAHLQSDYISQSFSEYYGVDVEASPQGIVKVGRDKLRNQILKANVGLSGGNVIVAETGRIGLIENEGNISLITRIPSKHIALVGVDKVVETLEEAATVLKMAEASIDLNGGYISFINGPSSTSDIQGINVLGMLGAQEMHVVLLYGYRTIAKEREGFESLLKCINCGACYIACPLLHYVGVEVYKSEVATSPIGVIKTALIEGIEEAVRIGLFLCTSCGRCKEACPGNIDIPGMIKLLRSDAIQKGLVMPEHQEMVKSIRENDNPFGKKQNKLNWKKD
ncbi:MAG: LUD domain-containing protein [Candidatus Helarchaeota archaeon]